MMEQIKPFSAITPDMIQDWKAKYGDILSEVTVGDAKFIVKLPNRRTIEISEQQSSVKKDHIGAMNTLIANCLLGGDLDVMENDGTVFKSLVIELTNLFSIKKAIVKKL